MKMVNLEICVFKIEDYEKINCLDLKYKFILKR